MTEPDHMMTKEEANYQRGKPGRNCANCSMYLAGGKCSLVEGRIHPADVCDHWEAKQKAKAA
jgi:hypothetical protein